MTPKYIIAHHSMTKDGKQTNDWASIRRYHVLTKKWKGIGYHFGIEKVGLTLNNPEVFQWDHEIITGRMQNKVGAHCIHDRMNYKSLGICFIGNFDRDTMPHFQWTLGVDLVKSLIDVYQIPVENVLGHREVAQDGRSCPGNKFNMDSFREALKWQI